MNNPTAQDVKKLSRELTLMSASPLEIVKLFTISLGLIVSIFGLAFLESAWNGMRAAQKAKRLKAFAARFGMTPDDADKLVRGYELYRSHDDLLGKSITKQDIELVENFLFFYRLKCPQKGLEEHLQEKLSLLTALYKEGSDKVGSYAWYNGVLFSIDDPEIEAWYEEMMRRRKPLTSEINHLAMRARNEL